MKLWISLNHRFGLQESFTYIYALDRAIEGTFGAFGQPAVGWLTDPRLQCRMSYVVSCVIDVGMEMDGTWTCLLILLCLLSLLAFFLASSLFNAFHSSHHLTSQRAQFGTVWHVFHFSEDKIFEFNAESANNHECSPPDANSLAKGAMWAVFVWRCTSQQFPNFWPVCFVRNWRTEYWCHADSD